MNTEIKIVNCPEIPSSILLNKNVKELIIEDNEQFDRGKYYYDALLGDNWMGENLSGKLNELLEPSNTFMMHFLEIIGWAKIYLAS